MNRVCVYDCVYVPGPKKCSVEEVMDEELRRIRDGSRLDTAYDHVVKPSYDPEFYLKNGYKFVPVADGQRPLELAVSAVQKLLKQNNVEPSKIGALIYYDAIPWPEDAAINQHSCLAQTTGMTKLKYAAHVTQRNCSGGLAAIEAVRYLMLARPDIEWAVVAGGDCVATHCGEPRVVHNYIFGDAGSAALIGRSGWQIAYLSSRFIPLGGRRYYENLAILQELAIKGLHWSFEELDKAFKALNLGPQDMEYIVTNSPLFNRAMDNKREYARAKREFIVEHLRDNGLTTAHIAMNCLMKILNKGASRPSILHATGLGTNLTTMVISKENI